MQCRKTGKSLDLRVSAGSGNNGNCRLHRVYRQFLNGRDTVPGKVPNRQQQVHLHMRPAYVQLYRRWRIQCVRANSACASPPLTTALRFLTCAIPHIDARSLVAPKPWLTSNRCCVQLSWQLLRRSMAGRSPLPSWSEYRQSGRRSLLLRHTAPLHTAWTRPLGA